LIGPILQFEIKSHLVDKSQFKNKSKVTLKHWHKLHLIENQIAPANSVRIMDRTQGNMLSFRNPCQIDGMGHLLVLGYWPDTP
jgi:hypothetical protein